ncbi:hypothetical protein NIES4101_34750 [Calothrix sp. NIES-4101]|nr:hypothetical protein NIES4101_34750 [Calothrix sp. NIES-4101]
MQCQEKQINTKKIPRWFAKFILRQAANNPNTQKIFLALLQPMTPQEWCLIWMPIIHPGVELPQNGERNPTGYMKACLTTLSALTGYHERTVEGWFYGKPYHYSVEILLRCFHLIFTLQQYLKS